MAPLSAIDLFAGAGGATEGLRRAGLRVVAAVESDKLAAATYRINHPAVRLLEKDIRSVDPSRLIADLEMRRGQLALLKACPPCQGYSSIGKRDTSDPRNDLVAEVWRFTRVFEPKAVLMENVPGLQHDLRLTRLVRQLRSRGYSVKKYVLDATTFGVPQRRKRLIVIAVKRLRRGLPGSLEAMLPSWFADGAMNTAGDAIRLAATSAVEGDPLNVPRASSPSVAARLAAIPVGGSRFDLPDAHKLRCHVKLTDRNATASYSRVRADEPAPTMTTRCTTPACGQFIHPSEPRALTLREAATIQTFPLNYRFAGGAGSIERQIGNAVPVRMAHGLALSVLALVDQSTTAAKVKKVKDAG